MTHTNWEAIAEELYKAGCNLLKAMDDDPYTFQIEEVVKAQEGLSATLGDYYDLYKESLDSKEGE